MKKTFTYFHHLLLVPIVILVTLLGVCVQANPIPVYPDPEPVITGPQNITSLNPIWILLVFILDFFVDILIVYSGLYLLDRFRTLENQNILTISKTKFFLAVLLISLIGLFSELILGFFIGGALVALICIFISFVVISHYLFKLTIANSIRMGFFALIINIIVWLIIFTF